MTRQKNPRSILNQTLKWLRGIRSLQWIRQTWMYLVRIVERMEDNHIFLSAAAIAFNAILCFIPLLLIVFYVLGLYLDSEAAFHTIESYIDSLQLFPVQKEQLKELTVGVVREFISGSHLAGIIGVFGLIWIGSALFATLRTVLNRIFNIKDTKNLLVSTLRDLSLLSTLGVALLSITILLYAVTLVESIGTQIAGPLFESFFIKVAISNLTSFIVSFILFYLLFLMIPDERLPAKAILISSLLSALLWGAARWVFGYYVSNLWSIGRIYGPYAIVVAVAIWVYYSSITIIFAAEVGEMYLERKRLKKLFTEQEMDKVTGQQRSPRLSFPFKST